MGEMSVFWLRIAAGLYGLGLADAILALLRRSNRFFPYALAAFRTAVVFHFVAIVERSVAMRHLAANNFFETASLCALLLAVVYLFLEWRYHFESLQVFVFPFVFVLSLAAAMGSPVGGWSDLRIRGVWLLVHIVLIMIGYAGLLVSAGGAVFYLAQERRLKRRRGEAPRWDGLLPEKLPPLETLDSIITKSMSIGFVAVTLGVVAGSTWAFVEFGTRWIREPKIGVSMLTWAFYLVMVFLRLSSGWRGRRAAVLALTVLGFAALTWAAHVGLRPLLEQ
jgi:ABC-type uncharacterized transport system permease subunit